MAKIQNPQNEKGENLATEAGIFSSLENLSNSINAIKYFVSNLNQQENNALPVDFTLKLNVNTDLGESEVSDDQLVSAPAAKNYIDIKVGEERERAKDTESEIQTGLTNHINDVVPHVTQEDKNNWNTHIIDNVKHFKDGEHEQLFSDEALVFDSEKNVLSTGTGQYYGIHYIPSETFKFNKISITRDPNASAIGAKYLFIFKEENNSKVFVQKCNARPDDFTIENNICYWEFEPTLLEKDNRYFIIFKDDLEETYNKTFVRLQALKQSNASESLYFIDNNDQEASASFIPNIKIYGNQRLFATISEIAEHASNGIIHLTPEEKETVISLKSTNINNLYDKTDNIVSVANTIITFDDGTEISGKIKPENVISAQYAFRTTNARGDDPSANSKLEEFNKRTIYTSINGDTTTGGLATISGGTVSDGIELYQNPNDNRYYYRASAPVEYEQDLLWRDNEEYDTLGSLINGTGMFMRSKIEVFNDDLTCLTTAKGMFGTNRNLKYFKSPLPSLVNAKSMFTGCRNLKTWRVKLPSLVIGANMFSDIGNKMALDTVDTCLPNLTMARQMFAGCPNLTICRVPSTSFSNLYDAREMFTGCSKLTSINGNFESLEAADGMFTGCNLDLPSLQNIALTIRNWLDEDGESTCPNGINEDGSLKTHFPVISLGNVDINNLDNRRELEKIKEKGWSIEPDISTITTLSNDSIGFFARVSYDRMNKTHLDVHGKPCTLVLVPTLEWVYDKSVYSPMVSSAEEAAMHFNLTKIEEQIVEEN